MSVSACFPACSARSSPSLSSAALAPSRRHSPSSCSSLSRASTATASSAAAASFTRATSRSSAALREQAPRGCQALAVTWRAWRGARHSEARAHFRAWACASF
eukprot:2688177-Rhodomonas_salina.2